MFIRKFLRELEPWGTILWKTCKNFKSLSYILLYSVLHCIYMFLLYNELCLKWIISTSTHLSQSLPFLSSSHSPISHLFLYNHFHYIPPNKGNSFVSIYPNNIFLYIVYDICILLCAFVLLWNVIVLAGLCICFNTVKKNIWYGCRSKYIA